MNHVQHVAGVAFIITEKTPVAAVGQHGVDRLLGVRQGYAELRVRSARQAVEAVDWLEPTLLGRGLAPHAAVAIGVGQQPAKQRLGPAPAAEVAQVEVQSSAVAVDPVAARPAARGPGQTRQALIKIVGRQILDGVDRVTEGCAKQLQRVADRQDVVARPQRVACPERGVPFGPRVDRWVGRRGHIRQQAGVRVLE